MKDNNYLYTAAGAATLVMFGLGMYYRKELASMLASEDEKPKLDPTKTPKIEKPNLISTINARLADTSKPDDQALAQLIVDFKGEIGPVNESQTAALNSLLRNGLWRSALALVIQGVQPDENFSRCGYSQSEIIPSDETRKTAQKEIEAISMAIKALAKQHTAAEAAIKAAVASLDLSEQNIANRNSASAVDIAACILAKAGGTDISASNTDRLNEYRQLVSPPPKRKLQVLDC